VAVASRPEVAASVEAFIRVRARVTADDPRFSGEINLWEAGYVDSIGVVELIGFIEATFEVVVPDEVLFDPDFTSVNGIARIIRALLESPAAAGGAASSESSARAAGAGSGDSRVPA
jgi:acyl carrier protein